MKSEKKIKRETKLLKKSLTPNFEYDLSTEDKYISQVQEFAEQFYKYIGADPFNAGTSFLDPRIDNDFKIMKSLLKLEHIDHAQFHRKREVGLTAVKKIKDAYIEMLLDELASVS